MKSQSIKILLLLLAIALFSCTNEKLTEVMPPDGFVLINGAEYKSAAYDTWWDRYNGSDMVNIADFEIMDHPVTNAEYKAFIDATGFPPPHHWKNGKIPAGKEEYPVIFVNRMDVVAYTEWLTKGTGRLYRLPSVYEFELASRSGKPDTTLYYWGNDESLLSNTEQVNFNIDRNRPFNQWETYLKPARWGMQNNAGLYQMAGNVWQLVVQNHDLSTIGYKFRLEHPVDEDRFVCGGGWWSTKEYLVVGGGFPQSPGIRYPDLGFRLVRDPEGVDRREVPRRVCAATQPSGKVGLSWALLNTDKPETRFNVYRFAGAQCGHYGFKINDKPLANTSFTDENTVAGTLYQYRIVPVDDGKEHNPSEWLGVTADETPYPIVAKFKPLFTQGEMLPVFGNLEGYGRLNCVIRLNNGNTETSQDPGIPVQLEAFSYTGKSLWRKDIAKHENIYGSANNAPFNVWDMDGDGKDEVITFLQIGEENYVAILDGMSGKVKYKAPWTKMATDFSRSSTRVHLSIACLDGVNPSVITQTGIYENEIIAAYDNKLNKLWEYKSFMETSGTGGHKVEIADVDGDGKQEIIYGTTCLNHDGTLRWSIYRGHPDIISIHDYIPERPGLEVCFIVETMAHAGIYMVDANTGEIIWKNNREDDPTWSHGHVGWSADIWDGSPGMETMSNRGGHWDRTLLLYSSDGKRLSDQFPGGFTPLEWDGDHTRELIGNNGKIIGKYNGKEIVMIPDECPNPIPRSRLLFTADLVGDFRSELVVSGTDTDGRSAIFVLTAPKTIDKRYITPRNDLDYRLWLARNMGGGYGSVYEYELRDSK